MSLVLLPDSRTLRPTKGRYQLGAWWIPVYCANCGKECGLVPEKYTTSTFFLCDLRCSEEWGGEARQAASPDAAWHQRVVDEQLELCGRLLTPSEFIAALGDVNHPLTRLIRDRDALTPKAG